ncbi:MAG: formate--tetrahydrofolate ligase, partial [Clostridiaceae bacterium]|nr:formate--tetrahydrofolate ligase [Clostridiaceae bacterium]
MKTDIQIAQECQLRPIREIATEAGVPETYLEQYGSYKAKID